MNLKKKYLKKKCSTDYSVQTTVTKTGWTYESPNLAQYRVLKGALVSICLRGVFVYNLAMLIIEGVFYPFNVIDFVRGVKRN
ncbi:hypothetical protein ABK040_016581 [Willaertia magna]